MTVAISVAIGELLAAEIRTSPRLLEDLLEALASAPFPINPDIRHAPSGGSTTVSFTFDESSLPALREVLFLAGFSPDLLSLRSAYSSTL